MRRILIALALLAALAGTARAATYYLDAAGTGDFPTIAAAIAAAAPGDSILLAAGLYLGAGNTQLDYGGKDIVVAGAGPEATILDCMDSGVPVLRFENGETRAAVLRDLTLRNNYHYYEPTGVIIDDASPSVINVHMEGFGGDNFYSGESAINCTNSSALIQDTEVRACYGRGGIKAFGAVELVRVLVEHCDEGEYGWGGGIKAGGNATLREVVVRNCSTFNGMGGGVFCGGNVVLEDCRFEGNDASSEVGYTEQGGGGVACSGGTPILRRCVFAQNWARDGGGGLGVYNGSAPLLEDVLFVDNMSDIGGSIVFDGAAGTLRGVTIVGSRYTEDWDTYDGPSAIHCIGSSPALERVIVAFSEAGVGLWTDAASSPAVSCSDVFGNPGGDYGGTLADQTGLNGNISADPLFCDAPGGDYTLDASSHCLPANNDCQVQMGAFGWGCGVTAAEESTPAAFTFAPPQPNPFNPKTTLRFALPRAAAVDLVIFDAQGRRVARLLAAEPLPAGHHAIDWGAATRPAARSPRASTSRASRPAASAPSASSCYSGRRPFAMESGMRKLNGVVLLALLAVQAKAATYHLTADGTGDFATIMEAITAASPGDSIQLAAGLYLGAGNTQLDYGGKDIVIAGAGTGLTILDCEDSHDTAVWFRNGESRAAVLRDLTVRNNLSLGDPTGIRITAASPTLANLELADFGGWCAEGYANPFAGAALNSINGSPLVIDTVLRDCDCAGMAGMVGGAPEFERVTFEHGDMNYRDGGALVLDESAALVRESVFRECGSFEGGGTVYCSGAGSPVFEDCRFEDNWANSEVGDYTGVGGAVYCTDGAAPIFRRCAFLSNYARDGGGSIAARTGAHPVLEDVLIAASASSSGGSAIFLENASATLRRVTIAGCPFWGMNEHNVPSAVLCLGSSPTLERVIIAHNEVGVGLYADGTSSPSLSCCDVVGNPDGNYGGGMPDPTGSNGNISLDPLFCGGTDPETAFMLASGSPCAPGNNACGVVIGALPVGCQLDAVRISGEIALGSSEPLAGVGIDGAGYRVWSNAAGAFELVVPAGWSGTLTPAFIGYVFTPISRSYTNLLVDTSDQDFLAERVTLRRVPADFPTIQAAIDQSLSGDAVLVAPGTYAGPGFRNIKLYDKDILLISEAGSAATVLDCQDLTRGFFIGSGVTSATWIIGFTVRNGYISTSDGGGGMHIVYSSPNLRDVVVEDCRTRYFGGGIKLEYSSALLEDVVVRGCAADTPSSSWGGGLYCDHSSPTLRRALIVDNHSYIQGGGLYCYRSNPTLEQVTVTGNSSAAGGGIACGYNSDPLLSECVIAENTATDAGGIYCHYAAPLPTVTCTDVFANSGGDYGGTLTDQTGLNGNISADPLFCDAPGGDYTLDASSPCLPANNDCQVQIGAFGWGCGVTAAEESAPAAFAFAPPQPNPFNPKTTLRFALPRAAAVDLVIFDAQGRRVARLLTGEPLPAGHHAIDWDGRDAAGRALPSGVYFARFAAGGFSAERKLVLLR